MEYIYIFFKCVWVYIIYHGDYYSRSGICIYTRGGIIQKKKKNVASLITKTRNERRNIKVRYYYINNKVIEVERVIIYNKSYKK